MPAESKKGSVLVTGAAGFIGFHLSQRLIQEGVAVVGLDNLNDYYDVNLKKERLKILKSLERFRFVQADLRDKEAIKDLFQREEFSVVINLAAQAGVRHSITHPYDYLDNNILAFLNILEACRYHTPEHLLYASSSSVYGANTKLPFSADDNVDHPLALYAATKKSNELMAHAYSNLYNIPTTGMRFFSAYGPYGRPDMALFMFTKAILSGNPINIYNFGVMRRDFTYISDIVESVVRLIPHAPVRSDRKNLKPSVSFAPYQIFNVGNNSPVQLMHFIEVLEDKLKKKAIKNYLPLQVGDVEANFADVSDLESMIGFHPSTSVEYGIGNFVKWYREYYK